MIALHVVHWQQQVLRACSGCKGSHCNERTQREREISETDHEDVCRLPFAVQPCRTTLGCVRRNLSLHSFEFTASLRQQCTLWIPDEQLFDPDEPS